MKEILCSHFCKSFQERKSVKINHKFTLYMDEDPPMTWFLRNSSLLGGDCFTKTTLGLLFTECNFPWIKAYGVKSTVSAAHLCAGSPAATPWGWSEGRRWWRRCRQMVSCCSTPLMSSLEVSSPPGESWSLEKKREIEKGSSKVTYPESLLHTCNNTELGNVSFLPLGFSQ